MVKLVYELMAGDFEHLVIIILAHIGNRAKEQGDRDQDLLQRAVFGHRCVVVLLDINHEPFGNHGVVVGLQAVKLIIGGIEDERIGEELVALHLLIEQPAAVGRFEPDGVL